MFNQDDTEEKVEKGKQLGLTDFNQISAKETKDDIRERFRQLIEGMDEKYSKMHSNKRISLAEG